MNGSLNRIVVDGYPAVIDITEESMKKSEGIFDCLADPALRKAPYTKKPLTFVKGFQAVRMGLEPTTSGVTGPHSNQLNYRTVFCCV